MLVSQQRASSINNGSPKRDATGRIREGMVVTEVGDRHRLSELLQNGAICYKRDFG